MIKIAFLIGGFSYFIFLLGIIHQLKALPILTASIIFFLFLVFSIYKSIKRIKIEAPRKISILLLVLFVIQAIVNLVGVFGPELSFDALWYHLTLPKIFLNQNGIDFIPGGLFYYSVMPKLVEMLYIAAIVVQGDTLAKLIHFSFFVLISISLGIYARKFYSKENYLIPIIVFSSNLVVGWLSIAGYVDLGRTFYEFTALCLFVTYIQTKKKRDLLLSAFLLGFAASTKIIAFGSIPIFISLIFIFTNLSFKQKTIQAMLFIIASVVVVSPWLLFSFVKTGNALYPIFSNYPIVYSSNFINPLHFINSIISLFTNAADLLSPLYAIFIPFCIIFFKKLTKIGKILTIYFILGIFIWYITPNTGGGRFILPYLPGASLLVLELFILFKNDKFIKRFFILLIIFSSLISISYRAAANKKFIPLILGQESKSVFMKKNLNFNFGDFYDVDNYFKNNIKTSDKVLIYEIHNLYYVDFPFIHEAYVKKGDKFNFILIRNGDLDSKFKDGKKVYDNLDTNIKLYKKEKGQWVY